MTNLTTKQGEKIGEDKYAEHWSMDGHTYVQVPKWVLEKVRSDTAEAAARDALERVEKIVKRNRKRFEHVEQTDYFVGVRDGADEMAADTLDHITKLKEEMLSSNEDEV